MFELILHLVIFPAIFLVPLSIREYPAIAVETPGRRRCDSWMPRCQVVALFAFTWIVVARLKSVETSLQRVETKLLSYAFTICASPYLSEIVISAAVSLTILILRQAGFRAAKASAQKETYKAGEDQCECEDR